jgi:hypothetical protein
MEMTAKKHEPILDANDVCHFSIYTVTPCHLNYTTCRTNIQKNVRYRKWLDVLYDRLQWHAVHSLHSFLH